MRGYTIPRGNVQISFSGTKSAGGARFRKAFTRKELGNTVARQGDWIFDTQEGFCQKDHGECTG
jgi:hypothetical protein